MLTQNAKPNPDDTQCGHNGKCHHNGSQQQLQKETEQSVTDGDLAGLSDALFLTFLLKSLRRLKVAQCRRELVH